MQEAPHDTTKPFINQALFSNSSGIHQSAQDFISGNDAYKTPNQKKMAISTLMDIPVEYFRFDDKYINIYLYSIFLLKK